MFSKKTIGAGACLLLLIAGCRPAPTVGAYQPTGTAPRMATTVVAASDTVNKTGADLILTGSADQTAINTTIAAQSSGSQIFFRHGTYILTDEVDVTVGRLTLTGECVPYFATWGGGGGSTDTLGDGAIFKQTVSGKNGFVASGSATRTNLERLYIVAYNGSSYAHAGTGVNFNGTDKCTLKECAVYGWANGIISGSDTCRIIGNDFNENSTIALQINVADCYVDNNVIYSSATIGIWCGGPGTVITRNQFGQMGSLGIGCFAPNCVITHNSFFQSQNANTIAVAIGGSGGAASGCVVSENEIFMSTNTNNVQVGTGNTSGDAIQIGGTANGNFAGVATNNGIIASNHIDNGGASSSTGKAINFVTSSIGWSVTGNVITGGKFNSGSTTTIGGALGNFLDNNAGDDQSWFEYKVSGSDATRSGTLADITGLVSATLAASATYEFEANLKCLTSADTNGNGYAIHFSSAPTTANGNFSGPTTVAANLQTMQVSGVNAGDVSTALFFTTASEDGTVNVKGTFTTNAATTFSLQHRHPTAGTSTVKVGSVLKLRRVN